MEKLTKAEEPIMQVIWQKEQVFIKDIMEALPENTPYNTVSSIVRILESKRMVGHEAFGRTHRYFPLVSKIDYRKFLLKNIISNYFEGSYSGLISTIVQDEGLDKDQIDELKEFIDQNL